MVRNGQVVRLADFEKVSFQSESPKMVKEKDVSPPTLIAPSNMAPLLAPGTHPVTILRFPPWSLTMSRARIADPWHAAIECLD